MRNVFPEPYAAGDIYRSISKLLSDLGNPEPPLRLVEVRELLRLDKGFYSSTDDSAISEIVHTLKVGGQQVLAKPSLLKGIIGKLRLKALLLPDRRRILIDSETPDLKQRWSEAHEIGHDLIPWHADTMLGDDQSTLTPACHQRIEAEANYAAGRLLFLGDRFRSEARSVSPSIDNLKQLQSRYQNTLTSTLWRYIECSGEVLIGVIGAHPLRRPSRSLTDQVRYMIRSRAFSCRFPTVTEGDLAKAIRTYCHNRSGGSLGSGLVRLFDGDGVPHQFEFETFFNRHEALTLGAHLHHCATAIPSYGSASS